ncbi:MAG: hypothetical protein EWV85_08730 [Microcystis aeruginosa Ma_QC_C_20070703_M131]|uniref:Uncharacterized protein n=1 Tax=Microcystis aeruginosa Ma_QC_C_20070703_M131 TaxID=2486263 RepID=A0A551Y4C7_MICAE|nr:MAG: hypothetical protein EWV85_08730 [Microcystis aeruginosa Ma_QC_C_20070703_M131]
MFAFYSVGRSQETGVRSQETGDRRLFLFILPTPHTPHPTPHTPISLMIAKKLHQGGNNFQ